MKTLTEFPSISLKNAVKVKHELTTGGKTAEELPQALGEALKLEGDKLTFILNAVDLVGTHLEDLKRVVVYSLHEGEKAPTHAVHKGEHYYMVEYYPSLHKKAEHPPGKFDGNRRGQRKGRGGRDRDQKGGPAKNDRPERAPRPEGGLLVLTGGGSDGSSPRPNGGDAQDRPRRNNRRPRRGPPPHLAQAQGAPNPAAPRRAPIKPLDKPIQSTQASATASSVGPTEQVSAATPETPSTESTG